MPQMAIIQATPPKGQPQKPKAGASGDKEQNSFSPHLDKAVSQRKQPQADDSRAIAPAKKNNDDSDRLKNQIQQAAEPNKTLDIPGAADETGMVAMPDAESVQFTQLATATENTRPKADTAEFTHNLKSGEQLQLQDRVTGGPQKTPQPDTLSAGIGSKSGEPAAVNSNKPKVNQAQNILLDQLQRIIDQSDEAGTVSITRAETHLAANSINSMRSTLYGILVPTPPENAALAVAEPAGTSASPAAVSLTTETGDTGQGLTRSSQQVTVDNHDLRHQSFGSKIAAAEAVDTRQNFDNQPQGDELTQQTPGAGSQNGLSSGLSGSTDQGSTFSQIITTPQQPPNQMVETPERPILLPSGIIVQEDDIIQQLSRRMQIANKDMDTRINLKLHPAELGSLKIDLTVKEGSIRAHVVAQSQHTTELLEKNMAKLKTVLENQGYSVDEISITAESDSLSDFNLFEQQMFSHEEYTPKFRKAGKEPEAVFSLTDTLFAGPTIQTGVNVKI